MTYTIKELEELLALPQMDIDDFYDNGAYDEPAFEYHRGAYEQRQAYGKQLLAALQDNERLTRELEAATERADGMEYVRLSPIRDENDKLIAQVAELTRELEAERAKIASALEIGMTTEDHNFPFGVQRAIGYNMARNDFREALGATGDSTPAR